MGQTECKKKTNILTKKKKFFSTKKKQKKHSCKNNAVGEGETHQSKTSGSRGQKTKKGPWEPKRSVKAQFKIEAKLLVEPKNKVLLKGVGKKNWNPHKRGGPQEKKKNPKTRETKSQTSDIKNWSYQNLFFLHVWNRRQKKKRFSGISSVAHTPFVMGKQQLRKKKAVNIHNHCRWPGI